MGRPKKFQPEIFELIKQDAAEGKTQAELADILNMAGHKMRSGKPWNTQGISKVMTTNGMRRVDKYKRVKVKYSRKQYPQEPIFSKALKPTSDDESNNMKFAIDKILSSKILSAETKIEVMRELL